MKRTNKLAQLANPPPPGLVVRVTQSLTQSARHAIGAKPIALPYIDRELVRLSATERSAEVLRYSVTRAEYWLSPGGTLRAVLRISIKFSLLIGLPALLLVPVAIFVLEGVVAASALLAIIAANLAAMSISLIAAVIGFAVLAALVWGLLRRK